MIPKNIFQTFKTKELPWLTRFHIKRMLKRNPEYTYHFYDDDKILDFFKSEFPEEYFKAFKSLTIGAAKADFFRYAILYKKGGIYLDIDCKLVSRFEKFINDDDQAIISKERDGRDYTQWALIFAPHHPFLEKTLEICLDNIRNHKFPNDVHATTGPQVYTQGIRLALAENPNLSYRELGIEYNGHIDDKYKLAKFFLYKDRNQHWNKMQKMQDIIKPDEE